MDNNTATSKELSWEEREKLESEITEKFINLLQGKINDEDWDKFVDKFFLKQKENYPKIFKTKKDLEVLNLTIDIADNGDIFFNEREFYFRVSFKGDRLNFIDLNKTKFLGKVAMTSKKFEGRTFFEETRFELGVEFCNSNFTQNLTFIGSYFDDKVDFFMARFSKNVLFAGSKFGKNTKLLFNRSIFSGNYFELHGLKDNLVKEIDLDGAVFHCPAVFNLKLESCPDFSKAHFLNKFYIEETWLKNGETIKNSLIKAGDEAKFRFFKKYFSNQGNHFKEQEYFSYEMNARQKSLLQELKICKNKDMVYFWRHPRKIINWLKTFLDFALFFAYKATSNFGMSWIRPCISLIISAFIMCLYLEVPAENYFSFFNEFFIFKNDNISFKEAVLKTISPLSVAQEFKHSLSIKFHCLINATLIFLFVLGLRNKFKIK